MEGSSWKFWQVSIPKLVILANEGICFALKWIPPSMEWRRFPGSRDGRLAARQRGGSVLREPPLGVPPIEKRQTTFCPVTSR